MTEKKYRFETLALHGGQKPDPVTGSRGVPLYRTSSYVFRDTAHGADLFELKEPGNIYSRIMNPTQDVLEKRVALLEKGTAALCLASGTSAIYNTVINICRQGDEIVAASNLYGGTFTMFDAILPQFGITTRFVDHENPAAFEEAVTEKTRLIFIETIGNPALGVPDFDAVAAVAKKHHLPLVVDNTFATPALFNPIGHGADVVVHSLTKWMGGHGTAIGGVVVDAGKFDWSDERFTLYNDPDPGYRGLRFARDLDPAGPPAFITRLRLVPLRNLGACISPDNAWVFLQGLETLPLRMERHSENALAVAEFLRRRGEVEWVRYPGLDGDPSHKMAGKYLTKGCGGVVVFGIRGGRAAGAGLIDRIELFSHLANVGDAKSLILHPASTSHAQLSEEQQRKAGIDPGMIRLSIGLEHIDDIIGALKDALEG